MQQPTDGPQQFYDEYGHDEWDRLETGIDGRLEFEETISALEAGLPESGHVLDAGCGAGRYAVWLAERGYEVIALDLSQRQVEMARRHAAERGVESKVSVFQGSITDLPLPADRFDATCCLGGALSHVLDDGERVRAVEELRRITAPEAPLFVSVMGLLGAVQLYALSGSYLEALPELLEHGDYDAELLEKHGYEMVFTDTHFFRREEFAGLLTDAGVSVGEVVGLEGLGSPFHDADLRDVLADRSESERAALERAIGMTNEDPAVADISVHMLAIGQA
ncbi:class I SAM-dependent methyltransferase [Natronoarchaeum sp. GCM10025703]|uniref:class I SAM-dependent methyltransferase n=1 Tax=unclassified Natronoarchaeum TaxID=2620183 RepID=UPI003617F445